MLKLGVDTKDMDKAMQGLRGRVQKHSKAIGMAVTAAGGAIVAAGVLSVKKYAEMGDEVAKMARKTGFSTVTLSELRHAAELSGTSLTGLEKGVKKMAMSISDAKDGLETYTREFDKIGINVEDLEGLSPEEQFLKIATAIAEVEDPLARAAVAQKIFGRAGMDLIPMFDGGSEALKEMRKDAHDLGIVFDEEMAKKAEKMTDAMHRMKEATSGLKMKIADVLIPALMPLIDKITAILKGMQAWAKEHPGLTKAIVIIAGIIGGLMLVLGPLLIMLPGIAAAIPLVGAAFAVMLGPVGLIIAAIAGLIAIGVLVWKNWDTIKEKSIAIWESIVSFFKGIWKRITGLFTEHWDKILAILFPAVGIPLLIARNWDAIVDVVSDIWGRVVDSVSGILGRLKDVIWDFGRNALDWLTKKFEDVIAPIRETWEWIRNLIGRSPGIIMLGKEMEELGERLPRWSFINFSEQALMPALSLIRQLVNWTENFNSSLSTLRDTAKLIAGTFVPELLRALRFVIDALIDGMKHADAFTEALNNIPREVTVVITTIHRTVGGGAAPGDGDGDGGIWLQKGGIAMRPMTARIGEQAPRIPEAVIPLDKLEGLLGARTINLTWEVDGRTLARILGEPLVEEIRIRTGARF